MKKLLLAVSVLFTLASCTTVKPGHKGVEVSWGGKTNLETVYSEGMNTGVHWIWDEVVEYDVREHTLVKAFEFNDKNDMVTKVTIALDYNLVPLEVNQVHATITDIGVKIETSLSSAAKECVPQYSAVELNKNKRNEAEDILERILTEELPEFHVEFKRVRVTDVDIPKAVSDLATQTAVQLGKNELATKKEAEQKSLALAKVATAQGNYDAGVLDAKTKKLLAQPAILALKQLEVEMKWAEQGVSKYGNNNVYGSQTAVFKGMK